MVVKNTSVRRVRFDIGTSDLQDSNSILSRRVAPLPRVVHLIPARRPLRSNQCPNIKKLFDFSFETIQEFCFTFLKMLTVLFFGVFLIPYAVYKDLKLGGQSH